MSKILSLGWIATLVVSVGAILAATEFADIYVHLGIALLIAIVLTVTANSENAALRAAGSSQHAVGASTARHMALVWLWGAGVLGLSYMLLIPPWREWLHFFAAFAIVGVLCVVFAQALERDAATNSDDRTMLKLGRVLTIAQVVGMLATLIGLAIDPDKSILTKARPDWAANIVFVFGGLALLGISAYALWRQREDTA